MWYVPGHPFNGGRFTVYDDGKNRIVFSLDEQGKRELHVEDLLFMLDSVNSKKDTKMRCACDERPEPEIIQIPETVYQYEVRLYDGVATMLGSRAYVEDGGLCIFDEQTMIACWTPGTWLSMKANPILPKVIERKETDKRFADAALECC